MNLDQLLDPQRLAQIWAKKEARASVREATRPDTGAVVLPLSERRPAPVPGSLPEPLSEPLPESAPEPADASPGTVDGTVDAAPGVSDDAPARPSIARTLDALESQVAAIFARDGEEYPLVRELLDGIRASVDTGGIQAADIDDLEALLDALLGVRGWPSDAQAGEGA